MKKCDNKKKERYETKKEYEGNAKKASRSEILEKLLNRGLIKKVKEKDAVKEEGRKIYE
ncbi:hypothetical protein [Vibrio parahaemolyticus]|uniref:hypothetical protein n=1 Tax=Vibrio parahaemolyticus TaxID=670 RepID=UPI00235E4E57|nr:hypothetical protein [Vibrio parahaemolyticus]